MRAALSAARHAPDADTAPHDVLGNMRANGVRALAAWRLDRGCDHVWVLNASG